ncbi:MAG: hypothetical protein AABX07_01690, partial [Nanoarchaeota archaeon]
MKSGQKNEMLFVLSILKNPKEEYNANSLSKLMKISAMGSLKIARKLEKENIIKSRKVGRANIYKINFNDYSKQYINFLLKKEINDTNPYVKRWVRDLEKVKSADAIILFGSILVKGERANDIDALFIVNQNSLKKVKKEIESLSSINDKKIHPVYQTKQDLVKHLKEDNKVILNALRGLYLSGAGII